MCAAAPAAYVLGVDLLNDFILTAASSPWLPLVLFAVAVLDAVFPPVPSETVLIAAAAAAVASGDLTMVPLLALVAVLGAVLGDNLTYLLGRKAGIDRFARLRRPRIATAIDRAGRALRNNGAGLIIGARYIPVGRVAVNLSAGALGYPWRRFLPISIIAAIAWAAYSTAIGTLAGQWLEESPVLAAALGVVAALILGVVIDRVAALRRRRRAAMESADEPAEDAEQPAVPCTVAG